MVKEIRLHHNLKTLRKARKLTQVETAKKTGISQVIISNYESGIHLPSFENLLVLTDFFGVSLDELVYSLETPIEQIMDRSFLTLDGEILSSEERERCINTVRFERYLKNK